jgi:hypothetical protein
MSDAPDSQIFGAVGVCLEEAIRHFKAGIDEPAIRALESAVTLCEGNPAYCLAESAELGSSLHKVVRGCISNAIARGRSGVIEDLLVRLDQLSQYRVH